MVEPRYQDISMGMGPSIFREKIAMSAGSAAKGPMISDMTKELTNQKVSASLPEVSARIGAVIFFSLQNIFFMADLLFRMSWGGAESFHAPLCFGIYARAMPEKARGREAEKTIGSFFSQKQIPASHEKNYLYGVLEVGDEIYRPQKGEQYSQI